ncbi:hypothetical protein, partial [Escherichia coli]|uniref:hypothetical protein n=1 Tax=Escherichia coli TaxID=562 RepID=UPI001125A069
MRLKSVKLTNFRGYRDAVTVPVDPDMTGVNRAERPRRGEIPLIVTSNSHSRGYAMRLKSVKLTNFRGYRDAVTVPVDPDMT